MVNPLDTSAWPIVHYVMPDRVPDAEAEFHVAAFEQLLRRGEAYVLIFSGAEMPKDSRHFMKLYSQWGKRSFAEQQRLCRGAVRVEPDPAKRNSLWRRAMLYLMSSRAPYPYRIVASLPEARDQAGKWLGGAG
ncbi:hypothetical protein [Burkholderia gladioli]|uniref:Uncharacterized protein n=2 Tax=Burkholderia gladioli TaxID=28095 RepID=F2LSV2_BURGS|nr:hypothetical protein [Burkholderia gladioli]AEA65972.1 hypothetical protein bgla_4p2070 [Burkholderia gladioli BSR3]MBW5286926.1 hypothetical protein [Burkholderia gladioli]